LAGLINNRSARGYVVVEKLFYLDEYYAEIFTKNGLDTFEAVWNAQADIVDNPNLGRGGHSDVGILRLPSSDGVEQNFYLKRQANHNCRTVSHPFRGIPLAIREWQYIQKLNNAGVPTMDVACVGRVLCGEDRGFLVTKALDRYQSIGDWLSGEPELQQRKSVMQTLGRLIGCMHGKGVKHGSLYVKHVFVSMEGPLDIRLIDLEKSKQVLSKKGGLRDIETFFKRSSQLILEDKENFLETYVEASPISTMSLTSQEKVVSQMMAVE
jgi:tRNA A-37 threonylcarbamoyl transferase component Bud32